MMWLSSIQQEGEAAPASSLSIKTETFIQGEGERGFWSGFPEDLIFQILYRLPINDLFALKLVCKEWNFVISRLCIPRLCPPYPCAPLWGLLCFKDPLSPPDSEEVRDEHLKDPSSEDKLLKFYFRLLYQYTLGTKIFPLRFLAGTIEDHFLPLLPPEDGCDASDIRDCCNGLLLLASSTNRYYVANPVTKQRLLVPRNSHRHDNTNIKSTHSSLVFDPSFSLGFKIVRCVRPAEHSTVTHPMELDIFSSDTGQWSSHVLPLEPHGLYGFEWLRRSVYFNGALYSLSLAMYLVCIDKLIPQPSRNTSSRISKDDSWLDLEAWAIELPDRDLIPRELLPNCCGCIGFSSGCFYYSNRDAQGSSMFVWMLVSKGKNSEWVLIHTISIADDLVLTLLPGPNRVKYWKKFDCFRPRAFLPKDDAMVIAAPELIISYHLKTKLVNELWLPPTRGTVTGKLYNWMEIGSFPSHHAYCCSIPLLLLNNCAAPVKINSRCMFEEIQGLLAMMPSNLFKDVTYFPSNLKEAIRSCRTQAVYYCMARLQLCLRCGSNQFNSLPPLQLLPLLVVKS